MSGQSPRAANPAMPQGADTKAGTRSLERALRLLKELSSRGDVGWRITDLARQVDLDRATCHRMLSCFVQEGFAERQADDLKYYPGPALFEMGLGLPRYERLRERVAPRLDRLVAPTGCIASLTLRSGNDLVCVLQQRGQVDFSSLGLMMRVGTRRPLITSVGGLAILQQLPADEAARIVAENTQREFTRGGQRRLENLARMRERSARRGHGFTLGDLAPGIGAVAVPVRSATGEPFASLILTGSDEIINESSADHHHALLLALTGEVEADARACLGKAVSATRHHG